MFRIINIAYFKIFCKHNGMVNSEIYRFAAIESTFVRDFRHMRSVTAEQ